MKAVIFEEFGGAEKLKITDIPSPSSADLGPHEILIAVECAAVNPVDWKIREGMLAKALPCIFPIIPGWDAAGKVKAVGREVTEFKVGDEVFTYCRKPTIQWGTYAEYVAVNADHVAMKPKQLSYAQAATIPLAGLTAWQALFDNAHLKKGEAILIHAGAGGVGGLAIQLAKHCGAQVITTAKQSNHTYVKQLGADHVIDYSKEDFTKKIKELYPQGIDVVFDTLGGESLKKSIPLLKAGGRLVSIIEQADESIAKKHNITFKFVFVQPNGSQLKEITKLIANNKIVPPTIEELPLEKASLAQEKSRSGHTCGKLVLKIKGN